MQAIARIRPRLAARARSSPRRAPRPAPPSIRSTPSRRSAPSTAPGCTSTRRWPGSAMVLAECRPLWAGVEHADSVVLNPHKWLGAIFDCSLYLVRDPEHLVRVMSTNPAYLQSSAASAVTTYRDWGIALGRRFRALKLWTLIHLEGVDAIRARIRRDLEHARWLAEVVAATPGWRVVSRCRCRRSACATSRPASMARRWTPTRARGATASTRPASPFTAAVLDGRWIVRVAMGAPTTERRHVEETWRACRTRSRERRPRRGARPARPRPLRGLLGEVNPARARTAIGPDQSLTRELALGGLERVELAMRLEKAAGVELGETVLAEADAPRPAASPSPGPTPGVLPASSRPPPTPGRASPGLRPACSRPPPGLRPPWVRPGSGRGRADAGRRAAVAGRARRGPRPHPAAERRRQRDADHLRQPVSRCVRRRRRPPRSWRGAGRARRAAAPHRAGVLPRLHGHPARRRRPGAALPAVPRQSDRGVRVAPGRDPAQRRRACPADVRRGRARRRAPATARAEPDHRVDGAGHPARLRSGPRRPGLGVVRAIADATPTPMRSR